MRLVAKRPGGRIPLLTHTFRSVHAKKDTSSLPAPLGWHGLGLLLLPPLFLYGQLQRLRAKHLDNLRCRLPAPGGGGVL